MEQATLKYYDSLNALHSQTYDVLSVRGVSDVDRVRFIPSIFYQIVDGRKETAFKGFQRVFTFELNSINSNEDFITLFLQNTERYIVYHGYSLSPEEIKLVFEGTEYENEWLNDFRYTKRYIIEVIEDRLRTTFPFLPEDLMVGYIINHVKIIGTQASPELFTTNTGKLEFNHDAVPFPSINLALYNVSVVANGAPYQDAKINLVGNVTQAGSDISFYLAVSDIGNASADTYFYADITILMQDIT